MIVERLLPEKLEDRLYRKYFNKLEKKTIPDEEIIRSESNVKGQVLQFEPQPWRIEHFETLHQECIESYEFGPPEDEQLKFKLYLYPHGMDEQSADFISILLKPVDQSKPVHYRYQIAIVDYSGSKENVKGILKVIRFPHFNTIGKMAI